MTAQCRLDSSQKPDTLYRVDGDWRKSSLKARSWKSSAHQAAYTTTSGHAKGAPSANSTLAALHIFFAKPRYEAARHFQTREVKPGELSRLPWSMRPGEPFLFAFKTI